MKKLFIAFLLLFLTSCTSNEPILVGFSNSLTGENASFGIETMYGAQLAVEIINEQGGVKGREIQLVIKDDQRDPDMAAQVDSELMDEGVVAIIGHALSKVSDRAIENADENNFLIVSPTISTNKHSGKDDNMVRVIQDSTYEANEMCRIIKERPAKKLFIITEDINTAYTGAVYGILVDCLPNDYEITHMNYSSGDLDDYTNVAEAISESDSELIVMISPSTDVINIEHYLQSFGETRDIFVSHWGTTTDLLKLGKNLKGNISGVSSYYLNSDNPYFQMIYERYEESFGIPMSFSALYGFESVIVLTEALENVNKYTTENLKEYIVDREYQGVINTFYIDEYGDAHRKVFELFLIDGKFVT